MAAMIFLLLAIALQLGAAAIALGLIRATKHAPAWILISIGLILMTVRRIVPLIRMLAGSTVGVDPVNEFIGMALSGFMLVGVAMIGPIFRSMFEYEKELEDSERRFRSYFELPIVGEAILSSDFRLTSVNDRMCDILGLTREALLGSALIERTAPEDVERERGLMGEVSEGLIEGYAIDKRLPRDDAGDIWVNQGIRRVRGPEGKAGYYVVVIQDISERKAYEDSLKRSAREKEVLLRELFHRTRNNMQVICSILDLESNKYSDPRILEGFRDIENRITTMSMVHDRLFASHDLWNLNLAEYFGDLAGLLVKGFGDSRDRVRLALDLDDIQAPIDTAIPCGLILNELVSNCLKHAFPNKRTGTISITLERPRSGGARLIVADDGIGLAEGLDIGSARGLGLREAEALACQIGGTLEFSSARGLACSLDFPNGPVAQRIPEEATV